MKKQLFNLQTSVAIMFLMFGMFSLQAQVQMDLPVNFEGFAFEYGVIGFEGSEESTIEVDPTGASNTVVKVIKSSTAQPWAGTTVTTPEQLGFASPIPFTSTQTQMSVRVWSPDAGIVVRLKVEKHNVPTMSVETDAITTVANGWETLVFDFANQGSGTAALNLSSVYDKASIFFNYGVSGATAGEKTYYFDDIEIYQPAVPTDLVITTTVCSAASEVRMTGPFWGWDPTAGPVGVNNGDGTFTFTFAPAPTANMEYLLIVDGVQENLVSAMQNGGTCAPVTDYSTYANRIWNTTDPLTVSNTYGQCVACTPPPPTDLVITTTVCTTANEVRLTGPFWGWDPTAGPVAVNNGDGTFTFTFAPAPTANMEYLLIVDGVQENLISAMQNGGTCAPITDYTNYANRIWNTTDPLTVSNTYGQCVACTPPPPTDLVITTTVCSAANEVRLTGPFWGWDPTAGPVAVNNGDGTFTFTFAPAPTANMEYLLIVDGVQENLISAMVAGGTCAPVTDYANYANRIWNTTDPLTITNTYGQCVACTPPPTDLVITTTVCSAATEVRLTGPFWGWDPTAGPVAVNNGDGTFTFTFAPAPTANMEYLLIVDGVQENLISAMVAGGTCAPVTDYANYANRIWNTTDPLTINNTYGQCSACVTSTDLVITTTVCNTASTVRLTGPFWGWDPNAGPVAVDNGDGTWTFTFSPAPTANMEYLLIVDGVQENLISAMVAGGTCAPVTDYANYANRIWNLTDPLTVTNTYGQCGVCSTVNPNQMDLPVTFEGSVIEYGVIGFEGAEASTIEVDPTDATNTVVKVIKANTAQPWAGTTVTAPEELGFASAIPFSTTQTQMSVRVWSPDAGIVVRLKVEDHSTPTISVETDATTTVANGWETLVFDFANEGTGTAALNLANTYDKASIFFNYGVNGATAGEKTYYFDDIEMYNATSGDDLLITVDVCSTTANEVRLTGPFWSWDPTAGPFAVDNGDGTWTFTFSPAPTTDMEYLVIVNGVQENLIADMQNGGNCAPVTDYFAYANRKWVLGSGDVNISYDRCVSCSYPDLIMTTEVCDPATQVNLTGPIWGWNPAFGPQAVDNGDGTWTFTISPAPNDTLEYLLVKNGVVENLIQEMVNGGGCAPITDYATYANRRWLLGQGDVANTYGKCGSCIVGIDETSFENLMVYPNPSSAIFTVSNNTQIEKVTLYSIIGEKVLEKSIQSTTSTLDLSAMASGIYHLNIQVGGETKTIQLIKE